MTYRGLSVLNAAVDRKAEGILFRSGRCGIGAQPQAAGPFETGKPDRLAVETQGDEPGQGWDRQPTRSTGLMKTSADDMLAGSQPNHRSPRMYHHRNRRSAHTYPLRPLVRCPRQRHPILGIEAPTLREVAAGSIQIQATRLGTRPLTLNTDQGTSTPIFLGQHPGYPRHERKTWLEA